MKILNQENYFEKFFWVGLSRKIRDSRKNFLNLYKFYLTREFMLLIKNF